MAICSSILVWKILWTEEPSGLWSMGSQRAKHDCSCTCEQRVLSSLGIRERKSIQERITKKVVFLWVFRLSWNTRKARPPFIQRICYWETWIDSYFSVSFLVEINLYWFFPHREHFCLLFPYISPVTPRPSLLGVCYYRDILRSWESNEDQVMWTIFQRQRFFFAWN